jgi:hypothetical protein
MSHGIKSLANNLAQYGRNGDTMVAHINPQEAGILKALGGSGTINPVTGLPEFGFLSKVWRKVYDPIAKAAEPITTPLAKILKPVEEVTLQPVGRALASVDDAIIQPVTTPISKGLATLDDKVAETIPGGWGTLAQIALSFVPGVTPLMMGAAGAFNGSGVMRGDNKFNLQGAMAGGAMSYGMASLGEYAKMAGDPSAVPSTVTPGGDLVAPVEPFQLSGPIDAPIAPNVSSAASIPTAPSAPIPVEPLVQLGGQGSPGFPSMTQQLMSGNVGDVASQIGGNISNAASNVGTSIANATGNIADSAVSAYDKLTTPATYSDAFSSAGTKFNTALEGAGNNISQTASGIKNLLGAGDMTFAEATKLAAKSGVNPLTATAATIYGGTGLMAVEEQKEQLKEQLAAGKIAQEEYNNAVAEIDRTADIGKAAVAKNPFNMNPDRSTTVGETSYARNNPIDTLYNRNAATDRLYAVGGIVTPPDDQTQMANQTPMQNLQQSNAMGGLSENNLGLGGLQSLLKGFDLQATNNSENQGAQQIDQGTGSGDSTSPLGDVNNTPAGQIGQPTSFYQSLGGGSNGNGLSGGGGGGNSGAFPLQGQYGIVKMAAGGMPPRFLSGGGDGMSDSIRASIDGKQEARLADGEFVIPADVVSHLGNGSSKAGAKQLYSMMNKVRRARTGNPKQGKQINPNRYMPA